MPADQLYKPRFNDPRPAPLHKQLAEALVAFQAEAPHIGLDGTNPHFRNKFPTLANIMATVRPALAKHGLALTQHPTYIEGAGPALRTKIWHVSGESEEDTMLLLLAKNDPQGQGSAVTYARRYAALALLGLVGDEDDDGAQASSPAAGVAQPRETSRRAASAPAPVAASEETKFKVPDAMLANPEEIAKVKYLLSSLANAGAIDDERHDSTLLQAQNGTKRQVTRLIAKLEEKLLEVSPA